MNKKTVLASIAVGYRFGAGSWPHDSKPGGVAQVASAGEAAAQSPERTVLYWKNPDGKPGFSPTPQKTADGRDFVPVYDSEEASFKDAKPAAAPAKGGSRRILYYRNPIGLPDTSPAPKKDGMGMDYIPALIRDPKWYEMVGIHSASLLVNDEKHHSMQFIGSSAIGVWTLTEVLHALFRRLNSGDDPVVFGSLKGEVGRSRR